MRRRIIKKMSLNNDAVGPFDKRHKDGRAVPFRSPVVQVCSRDPTGPGTGASRKNGMCFATIFSGVSLSGGQPTCMIASVVALRIN